MASVRYIIMALMCITEIAGIVGGILVFSRKKRLAGGMAVAGFLLLGLNLLVNIGLELTQSYALSHFITAYYWISPCIAAPLTFLGIFCLMVAVFSMASKKADPVVPPEL